MIAAQLVSGTTSSHRVLSVLLWSWLALASCINSVGEARGQTTTAEIYEKSKGSVVLLLAYDSAGMPSAIGSGFFIEATKIATNAHVVRSASKVVYRVLGAERALIAREISNYSEALDLAVLEAAEPGVPVTLSAADSPHVGERVVVIGNPRGLEGSVSEGIVAGIRGAGASRLIQITAPISPGNSGGPVFDTKGEVIGVASATLRDSQNINFAIPSGLLSQLRSAGKSWEPQVRDRGPTVPRITGGVDFVEVKEIFDTLSNCSYSVQNRNTYAIKNLRYLVVLRNPTTGNVVSYSSEMIANPIPPGLAIRRMTDLPGGEWYSMRPSPNGRLGTLEFRVLTYDIQEPGARPYDDLLK